MKSLNTRKYRMASANEIRPVRTRLVADRWQFNRTRDHPALFGIRPPSPVTICCRASRYKTVSPGRKWAPDIPCLLRLLSYRLRRPEKQPSISAVLVAWFSYDTLLPFSLSLSLPSLVSSLPKNRDLRSADEARWVEVDFREGPVAKPNVCLRPVRTFILEMSEPDRGKNKEKILLRSEDNDHACYSVTDCPGLVGSPFLSCSTLPASLISAR